MRVVLALGVAALAVTSCSSGPRPEPAPSASHSWPVGSFRPAPIAAFRTAGQILEVRVDACGFSPVALVQETDRTVSVAVQVAIASGDDGCEWRGAWASVVLDAPVARRVVVDASTGTPPPRRTGRDVLDLPLTQISAQPITGWMPAGADSVVVQVDPGCGLLRARVDADGRVAVERLSSTALVCLGNSGSVAAAVPPPAGGQLVDRLTGRAVPRLEGVPEPSPYAGATQR